MNNLIEFKQNYLVYPFGLYNNSIICYFNSLIQTLLSCTSLTEYLLHNEQKFINNSFIKIYINIIKKYITNQYINKDSNYLLENENLILFNEFINNIKNKNIHFGYNQEDSGELLILLLEIINDDYINNLFLHKYKCDIYCLSCKYTYSIKDDISIQFEIDINAIDNCYLNYKIDIDLSNLNKYIRNNYSELIDYECKKCKKKKCIKLNRLIKIPTIVIINLNKYLKKIYYNYPIELNFKQPDLNKQFKFKLISTINHSGSQNFGHYISKSIRKNNIINITDPTTNVYILNDNSYNTTNFKSDINTYMLIYHYNELINFID